jgi:hypothetical protein
VAQPCLEEVGVGLQLLTLRNGGLDNEAHFTRMVICAEGFANNPSFDWRERL